MRKMFLLLVVLLMAMTACTGTSGSSAATPTLSDSPIDEASGSSPAGIITPTAPYPYMDHLGLAAYTMLANEQLGDIPSLARVRIDLVYVLDGELYYAITAEDGQSFEAARPDQISPIDGAIRDLTLTAQAQTAPMVTPTSLFDSFNGMNVYGLITLEDVSDIPAGSLVKLSYIRYEDDQGTAWYGIRMADGRSSEARVEQLALAPGVTPGPTATRTPAPVVATAINATWPPTATRPPTVQFTPTAIYGFVVGTGDYALITKEQVGSIAAGTLVCLTHSRFDGSRTVYGIMDRIGIVAEAYESQLSFVGSAGGPTPTAVYANVVGTQSYILLTTEQVGEIGIGQLVRLTYSMYDGQGTLYGIATQGGLTAVAREDQLGPAGRDNGIWVPTPRPGWTQPVPSPTFQFFDVLPFYLSPDDYPLQTLVSVGSVGAGESVKIGSAYYDGEYVIYQIVTEDGRFAEYKQHELRLRSDFTPQPTTTWYSTATATHGPTPTAALDAELRDGTILYTRMLVVPGIPIGAEVRVISTYYDGQDWLYEIEAVADSHSGFVRDYHLGTTPPPPGPQPSITWTPSPDPPNTPLPTSTHTPTVEG